MTGLIYLAIIAMWVAVLVPMWLRRHDHQNESRNVDRFNSAMRTLSRSRRRHAYATPHETVQPRRDRRVEVSVAGAALEGAPRRNAPSAERAAAVARALAVQPAQPPVDADPTSDVRVPLDDRARRRSRREAARRRRRVLVLLTVVAVLTAAMVLAGLLRPWAVLLPLALLALFVVLARRQVAAAARADRAVRRQPRRVPSRPANRSFERPSAASAAPAPTADLDEVALDEPPRPIEDPDAWQAVPTTLPTYVTAPPASHIPRVIDLTHPGAWTAQAMLEQAAAMRQRGAVYDREVDERVDQLRAEQEAALADADDDDLSAYVRPVQPPRRRAVND